MQRKLVAIGSVVGFVLLGAAACGGDDSSTKAAPARSTTAAADAMAAQMQPGADQMKVSITAPAEGTKVTTNDVTLKVAATGYELTCDLAGKPVQAGKGHYHVEIDKSLVNMYCGPEAKVSLQNVKPGKHTFTVLPAQDDHAEVMANAASVTIDYEPAVAAAEIKDAASTGNPSIRIVSPKDGDTVSGKFDIVVDVQNYNLSCDLYGKPAVAGYGHWHLNLDTTDGPMMGMMTMAGMSCEKVFHASTDGLASGSSHTLIALLTDNGHAPLMSAEQSKVQVKVK